MGGQVSNTGYGNHETDLLYFVKDDMDNVHFVLVHDKQGNHTLT